MPIDASQLTDEQRQQFSMFEMLLEQMTDEALEGFFAFLTEKLEERYGS